MNKRRILHVDINSYFAIILQQENPKLRGKPLGVLKSAGRSCIIAASKEAKIHGVKTGSSLREARVLCPQLITVVAEFDFYLSATKRLHEIFRTITPDHHIFSLDEAFLEITNMEHLYPDAKVLGERIQERIKDELGEWVTSNVGISYTKLLAKMAGEISPKGSVTEITEENRDAVLKQVGFDDVCGVGRGLSKKLALIDVSTPYQIRAVPDVVLHELVGALWAKELRGISFGEDSSTLRGLDEDKQPFRNQMKSVSRSITGYSLCDDEVQIKSILYNLTEEICFKARRMGMAGRYISVMLQGSGQSARFDSSRSGSYGGKMRTSPLRADMPQRLNHTWYDHRTLKRYLNRTDDVFTVVYDQMYQSWTRQFKVIRFLVCLTKLRPMGHQPLSLFPEDRKKDQVYRAIDELAEKYGLFTVRSGVLVDTPVLRPEVNGFFGDKTYYLGGEH